MRFVLAFNESLVKSEYATTMQPPATADCTALLTLQLTKMTAPRSNLLLLVLNLREVATAPCKTCGPQVRGVFQPIYSHMHRNDVTPVSGWVFLLRSEVRMINILQAHLWTDDAPKWFSAATKLKLLNWPTACTATLNLVPLSTPTPTWALRTSAPATT
jgi:hypothetical protein